MVYETDFYTSRRPYRASPSLSTYTVTSEPSRQVRILPGLGKVHFVHSYDRIVPYIGHKRLTVVTQPPVVMRVRPSTLYREFDRIENKFRPSSYHSYTNDYLNSESHVRIVYVRNPISSSYPVYRPSTLYTSRYGSTYDPYYTSRVYYPSYLDYSPTTPSSFYSYYNTPTRKSYSSYSYYPSDRWYDLALYPSWRYNHFARTFDDETRLIRAQTASLLNQIHNPVPRAVRPMYLPYVTRYDAIETPARLYNDNYINRMLVKTSYNAPEYTQYWSNPTKKSFCQGRMACVSIVGGKAHPRRRNFYVYHDDPVRNDIQLLSYYINRFRDEKKVAVKPIKVPRPLEDGSVSEEMIQLKEERAARMAKIIEIKPDDVPKVEIKSKAAERAKREAADAQAAEDAKKAAEMKKKEEAAAKKAAEEAENAKKEAAAKKKADEAKAKEDAERKDKEAKEAAEKAAELEKLAEQAKQEELAKQAEIEKAKKEEEERVRAEEEKRLAEAAKAEEERQQLLRLEEIARQAEDEKEAELARQAEELAELARQEAELAEQAKAEEEAAEQQRKEAEAADLAQKEAELAELECKEKELTEMAEQARVAADEAQQVADNVNAECEPEAEAAPQEEQAEPIVEEPESPAVDEGEAPASADEELTEAEGETTEEE